MKILISLCAAGVMLIAGCKKNKNSTPEPINRIREILSTTENKVFFYDNDNRLTRINSSDGYSIRVTYSATEIIVQTYFSNDQPDPQGKYSFTIANGRITSGRKYLPNGAVVHEYGYQYDNQQHLASVSFSIKDFTGNDTENHSYQLYYDAQDNLQQIAFKRFVAGQRSDSASVAITSYTGKSFITWKHMRFDYFGKAAVGHRLGGQVAIPFSLVEVFYPAQLATKAIDTKNYRWNAGTGTWGYHSSGISTFAESVYQHNGQGWLTKYLNYTIQWDD